MLFNSFDFLVFFAIVLFLHNLPFSWRTKKFNLLIASYLFYAAWNPPFVILIWLSTLVDWFAAKRIPTARTKAARRFFLFLSLGCNLGLLGFFKYGGFFLENFCALGAKLGLHLEFAPPNIILPVGISFYTFQTLSYTLDVYRGKTRPWESFLDFALFVTFFPQLVAGPIVRSVDFLPQCVEPRKTTTRQLSWGLTLLTLGIFEKVVVADTLMAPICDRVYAIAGNVGPHNAWAGTLAFSIQVFCDFAGYSACAIGVAMCLGFSIQDNFRFPYASVGFSDFWERWHLSLSSWLRDYVFISFGGSRRGKIRVPMNLMATMLIGGLWHGASWTFVLWGGMHGLLLIGERLLKGNKQSLTANSSYVTDMLTAFVTYILVVLSMVLFRARSLAQALSFFKSMLFLGNSNPVFPLTRDELILVGLTTMTVWMIHWFMRNTTVEHVASRLPSWARGMLIAFSLVAIIMSICGEERAFIYFQF